MKIIGSITSLILLSVTIYSQSWISSTRLISSDDMAILKSAIDANSNIFTLGYFNGSVSSNNGLVINSHGGRDYFLSKFDNQGNVEWLRNIGSSVNDDLYGGIEITADGNVIICGGYLGYLKYTSVDSIQSTGSVDLFLAKYSTEGDIIWCKNIGTGSNQQRATCLRTDQSGNLLLAGFFRDSISISNDLTLHGNDVLYYNCFYTKLEPTNGDALWAKNINTINSLVGVNILNISTTNEHYYYTAVFSDSIEVDNDTLISNNNSFDILLFKSDLDGNIEWYRKIYGTGDELAYCLKTDLNDNIYIAGHYESPALIIDSTSADYITISQNSGRYDFFVAKYDQQGELLWAKRNGGKGNDRLSSSALFQNELYVSGYFSDTLSWGGIELHTKGLNDRDMFIGNIDESGNYRSANSYSGRNYSEEDARSIFVSGEKLYTVIRSNSDLLVLGDSIYTSSGDYFYVALGIIGCLPISIDNVIVNDVNTCYGDSTGSLQILATGGFGSPFQYSIDNGLTYQKDISYFSDLPAGDYQVVVIDQKNCAQEGPVVTVGQPDTLRIELVSSADITNEADGSIVVAATGGTTPYTFTLLPDNLIQGFGTYTFQPGDSGRYVVQVNDAKNCGPVETDSIDIMDFYGVGFEDISGLEVRMFPNPASNMITLEMPLDETEVTLEVMSLTGQVMISRQVYPSGGVLMETIDVSDLSKGMYMLRVNGKTMRSGIVVN
ncbi:MAG: T9SS type A sorting domain-containing protein [Bacteroidales bacterium]|nr:T9SS type A sorting domain-containing protein [Bacteroidales bacterium]